MLEIFIITFIVLLIVVVAMAVGVIFGRDAIKGSCGGINNIDGLDSACDFCSEPCEKRKQILAVRETLDNNMKA
jgi:hypothetical protein